MKAVVAHWIHEHSAGGVVVRGNGSSTEVLIVKPAGRPYWQLPKGVIDAGESAVQAAQREVREEGGVDAQFMAKLEPIRFFYQRQGQRFVKTVDFFLMKYCSGSPADHDHEIDVARWVGREEVMDMLTFETEQGAVAEALELYTAQAKATA